MQVNTVSSPPAQLQTKTPEVQAKKPEEVRATDERQKVRQEPPAQKSEQSGPVLNAEGQKTGQVISVTA